MHQIDNVKWYDLNKEGYIINSHNKPLWPLLDKCAIYAYKLNISNEELIYIGSTTNIKQRFRQHKYRARLYQTELIYNSLLYNNVLTYGWDAFKFGIIKYVDLRNYNTIPDKRRILIPIEQKYLDKLNPGLNINKYAGSMLGFKHSKETKKDFSEARRGKCYKFIQGIVIRPEVSQATILKLKLHSKNIKVLLCTKKKEPVREFDSIINTAKYIGLSATSVSKYIKSNKVWNNTYRFILKADVSYDKSLVHFPLEDQNIIAPKIDNIKFSTNRRSYIFEVLKDSMLLYRFKSVTKASQYLNISRKTLTKYSQNNKLWRDKFEFKIINSQL